jgi:enoyl-CoA hydratase
VAAASVMTEAPPRILVDDRTPGVRVVTLNRPERLNAFDGPALAQLLAAVEGAADPGRDIRVLVIRGNGRAFCAGNDLKWLASGEMDDPAIHLAHQDRMAQVFGKLESSRQVVIAAVHGHAVAGGFELALAADILVVADDAQIGDAHLRRNLMPSGGSSQRLPRKLGLPRALYYLITGRTMSGREAERIGLAAMAVPADVLHSTALALASEIAAVDAHALAAMKAIARRALELPLEDGLALERWAQFRYRNESPALRASVQSFAAQVPSASLENT